MSDRQTITRAAIITGASRGIGAAVAQRLAQDAQAVVIAYAHGSDHAAALAERLQTSTSRSVYPILNSVCATGNTLPSELKRVIDVLLQGALDGMSAVIPYGDRNLATLRPGLIPSGRSQPGRMFDLGGFYGANDRRTRQGCSYT